VQKLFKKIMPSGIQNLCPSEIFADYILHSDVAPTLHSGEGLLICAPDKGARDFATRVFDQLKGKGPVGLLQIAKQRLGERSVSSFVDPNSPASAEDIAGKDVLVFDDMVRTGYTIKECCTLLKQAGARRVVFFVTHFYPSPEVRENLNTPDLDEIITTNTLPGIMNRDKQGRLRKKLTVLKIERWISRYMLEHLGLEASFLEKPLFTVDMSSKNPRWETLRLSQARRLAMEKKQLSLEELSSN
jgi:ribose-phosphate pyrophosphokinase